MMKNELLIEKFLIDMVVYYSKLVEESGFDGVVCFVYEVKVIY